MQCELEIINGVDKFATHRNVDHAAIKSASRDKPRHETASKTNDGPCDASHSICLFPCDAECNGNDSRPEEGAHLSMKAC